MTDQPPTNCITFNESTSGYPEEILRLDSKGFHYRGQFIEDAGEAHRLMVGYLRRHQPLVLNSETND